MIAENKKVRFDYFVEETFEAGVKLEGAEIKSIRAGNVNLKDSFCYIRDGEIYLKNAHISPYEKGCAYSIYDPRRDRKLLMHKSEINRLFSKVQRQGYTVAVTKLYFNGSLVKAEVALCKGKKLHDKRRTIAEREQEIAARRAIKEYNA